MNETSEFNSRLDLQPLHERIQELRNEIRQVLVGQDELVELLLTALLADGHVLLEGVPGVAKTLTAKLLARSVNTQFSRIQFTPDLMPSDILGTAVFNMQQSAFEFKAGPIFSNLVLIDEINRAPAKTQAALFEVMEERQVTMDGKRYPMEEPFLVLATQNPIEQEGTYRLPEAQLDRFLFKLEIGYPSLEEEVRILEGHHSRKQADPLSLIKPVLTVADLHELRRQVQQIHVQAELLQYMAAIVAATRSYPDLYLGASPRASIALLQASKALAALQGRDFVTPEDVKRLAVPVLTHRVALMPEREMDGTQVAEVIQQVVDTVEVPR